MNSKSQTKYYLHTTNPIFSGFTVHLTWKNKISNLCRANKTTRDKSRVSVQGVKSLGGHFACLCRGFEFYDVKKDGNTFTLLIIFILKSLQKEQNSTNLLL